MSSWHYYIESKKRIKVIKENKDKKTILIDDVFFITENNKTILNNKFLEGGKEDKLLNFVLAVTGGLLVFLLFLMLFGDFFKLDDNLYGTTSGVIATAGFIITLMSIPKTQKSLNKILKFGHTGNRLILIVLICLIPIYDAGPFPTLCIDSRYANFVSVMCSSFSVYMLYKDQ